MLLLPDVRLLGSVRNIDHDFDSQIVHRESERVDLWVAEIVINEKQ